VPISTNEHAQIQAAVDSTPLDKRDLLKMEAEQTLAEVNVLMGQGLLSKEASKAADVAIEILVRLEATERRKGAWWRAKRRLQMVQMYLGA